MNFFTALIKPSKRRYIQYFVLFFGFVFGLGSSVGVSQEITALVYPAKFIRKSKSQKIVLIQKEDLPLPSLGRIVLVKALTDSNELKPVYALRTLKTYEDKKEFAAKIVKTYSDVPATLGDLTAYEKTGDVQAPLISSDDNKDIKEIENAEGLSLDLPSETNPAESTTALSSSPKPEETPPQAAPSSFNESDFTSIDKDQDKYTLDIEKAKNLFPNWLSLDIGLSSQYIRTLVDAAGNEFKPVSSGYFQSSLGVHYARNLLFGIFGSSPSTHDSLAIEFGFSYYKFRTTAGTSTDVSSYTMVPFSISGRYNIHSSDYFIFYLYGGLKYNYVASSYNGDGDQISGLKTFWPLAGVGCYFQTGPNWYLRLNAGMDRIMAGVAVRY